VAAAHDVGDWANGSTGASPMKNLSTWRIASRRRSLQSQLLSGLLSGVRANSSPRRVFSRISVATLPPRQCMISNTWFQKAAEQKPGTTPRSRQISTKVRPRERRRTWRSRSSSVGMKNSGLSRPRDSDGRGAALGAAEGAAGGAGWTSAGAGGGSSVRVRGVGMLMSRPVAARAQHVLQRDGTQDAAVKVGHDGGEVGSAEARRDGGECGGGGTALDGGE
jgi:hypothetical protein